MWSLGESSSPQRVLSSGAGDSGCTSPAPPSVETRGSRTSPEPQDARVRWKSGEGAESEHACSPAGFQEILTNRAPGPGHGFASKTVLENSSGSKFPIWLAEASFITEKKKKNQNGLISELGKHQSQLLDDLKKLQCFWELSSIRSNVPKASVCPNPPLSAVSECSAAMLDAWATLCSVTTAFAYIS